MKAFQRGFTTLELIIAVAVLGIITITLIGPFGAYIDQSQKEETKSRLKLLSNAINEAYKSELMTVGDAGGTTIRFNGVDIANNSVVTPALLLPFQRYAALSAGILAMDGFNQPHRVFVSNELTQNVAGTTLTYRVVAVVSLGRNGVINSTFDTATGALVVGGDDSAEVVNGYMATKQVYDEASKKLRALASAYQNYFLTRFLANPSRSISVNYFANTDPSGSASANWDSTGTIVSTGGAALDADAINLHTALGLSLNDVTISDGQMLQVDNSSNDVNQPDQADPGRALPPYSVRLIAPMPGGSQIITSVSGVYN